MAVDILDMNAAVLDRFSLVGYFEQLARGFLWVSEWPVSSVFHR
jgi:hypothetical protein